MADRLILIVSFPPSRSESRLIAIDPLQSPADRFESRPPALPREEA